MGVLLAASATLGGCAVPPGPTGGERPELARVRESPEPRYDAFERTLLRDALTAAAHETRRAGEVAAARREGRTPRPLAPLPPPPAVAPRPTPPPPPPAELGLEENLVSADDLVGLAQAVGRDRRELARRAQVIAALEAPPPDAAERLTAVVFPPGSAELTARERARLVRALSASSTAGRWIVRTGEPFAAARAEAVRTLLVELGVPATAVVTARRERDVDVAEIAVRR